ncbi:hypothetical protein IWW54_007028, partial [Coemansia sp. RSA 2705]
RPGRTASGATLQPLMSTGALYFVDDAAHPGLSPPLSALNTATQPFRAQPVAPIAAPPALQPGGAALPDRAPHSQRPMSRRDPTEHAYPPALLGSPVALAPMSVPAAPAPAAHPAFRKPDAHSDSEFYALHQRAGFGSRPPS